MRLIVGFPPGSSADIAARVVGARMTQLLGQQVVVESKPGAASSIAAAEVARADKDGYTLFMLSSANIINEQINPKLDLQHRKGFRPGRDDQHDRHRPGGASFARRERCQRSGRARQVEARRAELCLDRTSAPCRIWRANCSAARTGIKMLHVPYKGSPEAATDLLAGRVAMIFSPASAVIAHAKEGKLKLLATGTGVRLGVLPDLPTMVEAGVADFETAIWFGLVAPAGTPRPVIDKLAKAVNEATAAPEVAKAWEPQGILPLKGGPDDLARYIASETRRWGEAAAAAGLKK